MVWIYRIGMTLVVGAFAASSLLGVRLAAEPHERVPPSVRSSPGGYRSFGFWHSGPAGGK